MKITAIRKRYARIVAIAAAGLCWVAYAQVSQLSQISWVGSSAGSQVLELKVNDHPSYELDELSGGKGVSLVLKGTSLGSDIVDLKPRGIVSSSSVQVSGNDVVLNIMLSEAARATVIPSPMGYQLAMSPVSSGSQTAASPSSSGSSTLTALSFARISGGRVQIDLKMDGASQDPVVFRTVNPPRIAFDFFGMSNTSGKQIHRVSISSVDSVVVAEDENRMRLVLNLFNPADYQLKRSPDGMILTVGANDSALQSSADARASRPKPVFSEDRAAKIHKISSVDFRRTPSGAGRVIVKLSDSQMSVDLQTVGGDVIAIFPNTDLPPDLEQRLDVVDFATPVLTVDTYEDGKNVKMVITPTGKFKQSSVQSGSTLIVDVAPLTQAEQEAEKTDEFGYSGERLSLNFQRISVRAALQVIADFTGLNFVTSDAISGDLSLRLKDVPWDQALDVILQTKGLAMRQKGNVVWVAPAEEITAKERQALEARQEVGELEPLVSELIRISYAKAGEVAKMLKSIKLVDTGFTGNGNPFGTVSINELQTEENSLLSSRGSVTVDERTNSLLIQDTAFKLKEIRALIEKLDIPVRQVQIETRIVQANDDFSRNIGARLGFTQVTQQAQFPGSSGANIGDVFQSGTLENTNSIRTGSGSITDPSDSALSVNLPAGSIDDNPAGSYAFTLAKLGSGFLSLLDLEISALQAEGRGKILANPKIMTTDKHEAHIEQGQERLTTFGSVFGTANSEGQRAVLSLTVTPQITPDDKVTLDVDITADSFVSAIEDTVNTKRITTQALLENGETVVIGGIYTQEKTENVSKVPILGDLPLIGVLFRKKVSQNNRTELLIFLTPRIIDPALAVR